MLDLCDDLGGGRGDFRFLHVREFLPQPIDLLAQQFNLRLRVFPCAIKDVRALVLDLVEALAQLARRRFGFTPRPIGDLARLRDRFLLLMNLRQQIFHFQIAFGHHRLGVRHDV